MAAAIATGVATTAAMTIGAATTDTTATGRVGGSRDPFTSSTTALAAPDPPP